MGSSKQLASSDVFVGGATLLQSLRTTLSVEHVAMLMGAPGSGKTALAREYTQRFAHEYTRVVWLNAATPASLMASVLTQRQRAAPSKATSPGNSADLNEFIEEWASDPTTLLVLDNVLLPEDALRPQAQPPIGQVLLIGRGVERQTTGPYLTMKPLDAREGALLVLLQARRLAQDTPLEPASNEQDRRALELARELADSPLALTLAGGYLNVTGCDLQEYLFAYRDCPERPESSSNPEMQTLEIVCDLTLARLRQSQPGALCVLQACALLSSCAIPRTLFQQENLQQTLFSEESGQLPQAIQTLLAYNLLDGQDETGTFAMHPLLQTTVRQTLPQEQQHSLREQLLVACLQLARSYEADCEQGELPAICFSLAGHIHSLATDNGEAPFALKETADAYSWAAALLGGQGLVREAEALLRKALSIWEQTAGYSYPSIAGALYYLAIFNAQLQQYVEAETYAQRALTLTAQILGVNHFRVLACLNALAGIYRQQGKHKDASLCYQKALSIGDRVGLQQHPLYFAARQELLKAEGLAYVAE